MYLYPKYKTDFPIRDERKQRGVPLTKSLQCRKHLKYCKRSVFKRCCLTGYLFIPLVGLFINDGVKYNILDIYCYTRKAYFRYSSLDMTSLLLTFARKVRLTLLVNVEQTSPSQRLSIVSNVCR